MRIILYPDDPFFPMAQKHNNSRGAGYVYEHRLVKARELGRCLREDEQVHHLNGDKHDNRSGNLVIISKNEHHSKMLLQAVQERLRNLEARWIIRE